MNAIQINKILKFVSFITILFIFIMAFITLPSTSFAQDSVARKSKGFDHATMLKRLKTKGFQLGNRAFIRIFKKESQLELWLKAGDKYKLFETYKICKWSGKLGPKTQEGDHQAPEGFYEVSQKQLHPKSRFHLSFNLGYPNAYDKAHKRTGSALMVHGNCLSIGCFAMTDPKIDEIYRILQAALTAGQHAISVQSFPFRFTKLNLTKYKNHKWMGFWKNLKQGHDLFEARLLPPQPYVCNKRYGFKRAKGCKAIIGW